LRLWRADIPGRNMMAERWMPIPGPMLLAADASFLLPEYQLYGRRPPLSVQPVPDNMPLAILPPRRTTESPYAPGIMNTIHGWPRVGRLIAEPDAH
jgi:hypothetical protein